MEDMAFSMEHTVPAIQLLTHLTQEALVASEEDPVVEAEELSSFSLPFFRMASLNIYHEYDNFSYSNSLFFPKNFYN